MKWNVQVVRQSGDKPGIFFRLIAPDPVLQVRQFEVKPELAAELMKKVEQGDRVRAAGNGDENALAARDQLMAPNVVYDFSLHDTEKNTARFCRPMQVDRVNRSTRRGNAHLFFPVFIQSK
jgi:hypothetical protein